jgi:hypothetical protein
MHITALGLILLTVAFCRERDASDEMRPKGRCNCDYHDYRTSVMYNWECFGALHWCSAWTSRDHRHGSPIGGRYDGYAWLACALRTDRASAALSANCAGAMTPYTTASSRSACGPVTRVEYVDWQAEDRGLTWWREPRRTDTSYIVPRVLVGDQLCAIHTYIHTSTHALRLHRRHCFGIQGNRVA